MNLFSNPTIPCISKYCTLEAVLNAALSIMGPLFIVTFTAVFLYGAWVYMTSKGDEDKIVRARRTFVAAIIGFTLAVLAPAISAFILGLLGIDGLAIIQISFDEAREIMNELIMSKKERVEA